MSLRRKQNNYNTDSMKIVNCTWELDNIGKKTAEIEISLHESVDKNLVADVEHDYEYIVVKIPAGHIEASETIQDMGYKYFETQMKLSKTAKSFNYNDRLFKLFSNTIKIDVADTEEKLQRILDSMTPMMFSTDRISCDPIFGPEVGLRRYQNWTKTEYQRGSFLYEMQLEDGAGIGFGLARLGENEVHGLLGGIYEKYQNLGYGLLTSSSFQLYCMQSGHRYSRLITAISSNNLPVLQFYNYLNYKVDNLFDVFIKHVEK